MNILVKVKIVKNLQFFEFICYVFYYFWNLTLFCTSLLFDIARTRVACFSLLRNYRVPRQLSVIKLNQYNILFVR